MAAEEPETESPSRPTNLKDSVTPAEAGSSPESQNARELPTTAECVEESRVEFPDRCELPLTDRAGVSVRREFTRETWVSWESESVGEMDDSVSGESIVEREAVTWGKALELMLESHEETRRTTVNLERGSPGDIEYAEFSIDAVTRWFAEYQKKYYARMKAWLREMTGGERPSGGQTDGELENPHVCLLTTSASATPNGRHVPPLDHLNERRESWSDVYDTMRNTMRSKGWRWQYDRRSEPHTGKRSTDDFSINSCYGHDHIVLLIDGEVSPSDLRPIIEKHVEKCDWAGAEAHDLDIEDWDANRDDVGSVEIKDPDELEDVAAYVADYASIDPLDLHERAPEYQMWAASVTAANKKTQSRSDAAGWAATADACKQRYESDQSDQAVDHGESVVRSSTRGVELECAKCESPHGIDQDQTLTAARTSSTGPAAADGGLDQEGELRDRWPNAEAAASVGQTPTERKQRERIKEYLELNPGASPTEVLGALGLPPDARRILEEVDQQIEPDEPVGFERLPEWRVKSVTIGEDEYPASAGTGVDLVETIDPVERLLQETKLGCDRAEAVYWRCERTGVRITGGRQMAQYLVKHDIKHPEVVDAVVTADRVPDPDGSGTIPSSKVDGQLEAP